jgi:ABC-type nitrate/sulfonate/bicarbonate transport system permease component
VPEAAERRPVVFRGGGFAPSPRRWAPWLAGIAAIALWQTASTTGALPALLMPSPAAVLGALAELVRSGELWRHLGASLGRIGLGWLIGAAAGLALGLAMGLFSLARAVGMPVVAALFPIPKIALLPLLILWFGIGEPSKVATIAFGVFFPTAVATWSAVDGVPRNLIRMAQSFGVPGTAIIAKVVLPGALPGILAGFRISTAIALILVVAAEMIAAEWGLGAFVLMAGNLMRTDRLVAGVVVLSILGLVVAAILTGVEKWLLRWR